MGAYDSRKFSSMFSERTEENLKYIIDTVNKDKLVMEKNEEFQRDLQGIIGEIQGLVNSIRSDANTIKATQKKGKDQLKSKLYGIASELEDKGKTLRSKLEGIACADKMQGEKLYEVTQMLNSLMGIAVLPYEMHKEYFKERADEDRLEENRGRTLTDIQREVVKTTEYKEMQKYIQELHRERKWVCKKGEKEKSIRDNKIVFEFLGHLRNAVCHSGDNAISILPLDEGQIINEILFYDKSLNGKEEFAMRITVNDLEKLIKKVADFYRNTPIGYLDKTNSIRSAEARVNALLGRTD